MTAIFFDRPLNAPLSVYTRALPNNPLVSVVMTCYNSAPWLVEAVRSILVQRNWERLELVVVNDGSTDESAAVIDRLASQDSRVRPFHLAETHGTYPAKNIGMSISRGDLITFMDSDDTSHPDRIGKQAQLLLSRRLIATTCNYRRVDASGKVVPMGGLTDRQALISLMFKRAVIADIGWFDSVRTSADDEFFERIRFVYGRSAHGNVDRTLYFALSRGGSLSTGNAPVDLAAPDAESMLSAPRREYVASYRRWYEELRRRGRRPYIPFNKLDPRPFPAPSGLTLLNGAASQPCQHEGG